MGNLRTCTVSFIDHAGVKHSADVTAETLFEAAVLGIKAISAEWGAEPALLTAIRVEVKVPSVAHEVTLKHLHEWLDGLCRSPKEKALKERLKAVMAG